MEPSGLIVLVVALFVLGVPLVMSRVRVPGTLVFREVPPDELTERQTACFADLDRMAAPIGYGPASTFRVADFPNRTLSRLYLSSRNPAVLYAHAITDRGNRTAPVNYCEFVTVFGDTLAVTTTNAPRISAFPPIPENPSQSLPNVRDLAELARRHGERAEHLGRGLPMFLGRDEVFVRNAASHERWCRIHVTGGYLRFRRGRRSLSPTWRLAVRGVIVYLNPFAGSFSSAKFAFGVVLGGALPFLGDLAAADAGRLFHSLTGIGPLLCATAWKVAVYTVAGAVLGWLFECRAFLWAFLLYTIPSLLAGHGGSRELVSGGWIGAAAGLVSEWKARRSIVA